MMFFAFLSYLYGIRVYKKGDNWNSTYAHMGVHVIANMGNILVYSGVIDKFDSITML